MAYHVWLATQQENRLKIFSAMRPHRTKLENRRAFFAQRYETHISFSIMQSIAARSVSLYSSNNS